MNIGNPEYKRRRHSLMQMMDDNSIAIIPSAKEVIRSRDTAFPFRQNNDFLYLSGFNEPDSVIVLIPGREHGEFVMFCREKDKQKEIWDGYRAGPEGVCKHLGADDAFPIDDIDDILPGLLEGRDRVYHSLGKNQAFDRQVMVWVNRIRAQVRSGAHPPGEFLDLDHLLHDMRLYKSAAEVRLMQQAANISAKAHRRAMQYCEPGVNEFELEAEIKHECALSGAKYQAYNPIVGGGDNACILHYVDNNQTLKKGALVLIDAGCEYQNYASDITRTFPVGGKFSKEQAALYNVVLDAQAAAINKVKPGNHWNEPHDISVQVITQGLIDLGLIKEPLEKAIEDELFKEFYMHKIGHWLGMDVHDVGDYKVGGQWRVLEPGMVMTVEPGIYVAPDNTNVAKKWRGIGIRIEDDVLVTKTSAKVLSEDVPKSIKAIESLMKKRRPKKKSEKENIA